MGPRPDGQVRDAIKVLLGTSMRPGEALALRGRDLLDGARAWWPRFAAPGSTARAGAPSARTTRRPPPRCARCRCRSSPPRCCAAPIGQLGPGAITEDHHIEPDHSIDFTPAQVLEATLRPRNPDGALLARPDGALLARPENEEEDRLPDTIDPADRDGSAEPA